MVEIKEIKALEALTSLHIQVVPLSLTLEEQ